MSLEPPSSGQPRPFELHRAPAPPSRGPLIAGGLALVAVALVLVAVLARRGTSALSVGPLEVTPGVGLGTLRFGQSSVADAARLLGQGYDGSVQRTSSQSFGPDGESPKVHRAVAEMAYRERGVSLYFSAEVDESFDSGSPAHLEMFERFSKLAAAPLSSIEVRRADVATTRGLRVGDVFDDLLAKHGPPARRFDTMRETRYLYPEGLVVEVEPEAKGGRVTGLTVSAPIDEATLDERWRVYEPEAPGR